MQPQRRIVIADDDPDTRLIVASVISALGYQPFVVADGQEAIDECQRELPDLIIADYNMPNLNGVELCKHLKSELAEANIPVLMLTARDTVKDKVIALEGGADDYLTKPFHAQELQARVGALLRMRDLNLALRKSNNELRAMQQRLVEQERQLAIGQLAGAAAHQLGQPLSAILLNCYLLEQLPKDDPKFQAALLAVKSDAKRMADMIEKLRGVKASEREAYFAGTEILKLDEG
jgi:DNA-binding response OmpR family regulator